MIKIDIKPTLTPAQVGTIETILLKQRLEMFRELKCKGDIKSLGEKFTKYCEIDNEFEEIGRINNILKELKRTMGD